MGGGEKGWGREGGLGRGVWEPCSADSLRKKADLVRNAARAMEFARIGWIRGGGGWASLPDGYRLRFVISLTFFFFHY